MQIQVGKPAVSTVMLFALGLIVVSNSMYFVFAGFDLPTVRQEGAARSLFFTVALITVLYMVRLVARQFGSWKKAAKR